MVSLVRTFIMAERSGNFDLHLSTIIEMLPFFYSSGHYNYAKSAHLYVQDMVDLEKNMDSYEEFEKFTKKGFFTIRRSNKYFCGTSSDMIIEQTLMRNMHSIGGLSRGKGITESVATSWLNTLSCSSYIVDDLEDFCGLRADYSEQHKDLQDSHIERDKKDLHCLIKWFQDHPPFPETFDIMSIATGVCGTLDVDCFDAEELGLQSYNSIIPSSIIQMDGTINTVTKTFNDVKLEQKFKVIPLAVSNGFITIENARYPINAKTLFDRFRRSQPDEAE